jgi:prophage maintenance system killer protein
LYSYGNPRFAPGPPRGLQGQGFEFDADPPEVDEIFRAVAARSLAEDDFVEWLREHVEKTGK